MPSPDFYHRFSKDVLERLLLQAANHPPEVAERLRWFLYFCSSGSVGATCRSFGIARTTFYRWAHRFNPYDLRSLTDAPNLLTQERLSVEPAIRQLVASAPASTAPKRSRNTALIVSVLLNAVFAGSVLLGALWQRSQLSANATPTTCQQTSALSPCPSQP